MIRELNYEGIGLYGTEFSFNHKYSFILLKKDFILRNKYNGDKKTFKTGEYIRTYEQYGSVCDYFLVPDMLEYFIMQCETKLADERIQQVTRSLKVNEE